MSEAPPLSREDAFRVFASVLGTNAVLVGGQAVAFWAELYLDQHRLPELVRETGIYVSRDVDFLGGRREAEVCAQALNGKVYAQDRPWDSLPVSAAQVQFVDSAAHERVVDFLINVCGIPRAEEVRDCAVAFDVEDASAPLYVMDPVTCLRTRLANIRALGRTDAKSLRQARLSIWIAREWLVDRADPAVGSTRDALRRIESVFRYAWRHDDAQHAALHHGIEAFGAIVPHEALPERFRAQRYPQVEQIVATARARLSAARRGGRAS